MQALLIFGLSLLPSLALAGEESATISASVGPHNFSWQLDQSVQHGKFIDGQPWIVVPEDGVSLTKATPSIEDDVAVTTRGGKEVRARINATVINPPVGTYFSEARRLEDVPAFGWDSRGTVRYSGPKKYDAGLAWDGETPRALKPGDIVTTVKSLREGVSETCLQAAAVLTVLAEPPPADAFRPGYLRSEERRKQPEFVRYSDLIDLQPYLISGPASDLFGNPASVPEAFSAEYLTSLLPGPDLMNCGLNDSRATHPLFNNSGATYGADVAMHLGDLAVGSLAGWLTQEQRRVCQIRFLQRAVDVYEAVQAGLCLSHNGGMLPGYGALLAIGGHWLDHEGMKSMDADVLDLPVEFYLSDYAQAFRVSGDEAIEDSRSIPYFSTAPKLNEKKIPVAAADDGWLQVEENHVWPAYRSAREIPNLKLRIVEGAGTSPQVYVVTGIEEYLDAKTGKPTTSAARSIRGGKLTVKPAWKNGAPDSSSQIVASVFTSEDIGRWGFKSGGIAWRVGTEDSRYNVAQVSFSPTTDYGSVNVGAYLTLFIAMHASGAEAGYSAGLDRWMIESCGLPGVGEVLFNSPRSRYPADPKAKTPERPFLGGLWKEQVLDRAKVTFAHNSDGTLRLEVPRSEVLFWDQPVAP